MKKIGLLAAALCLFSADAGAAFVSPYVGADYNYSSLNFGRESEDFYADNFNSLGVVAGVKLLSFLSVEGFYRPFPSGIRWPFSSRSYALRHFAPHAPFSFRGRTVSMI